MNMTWLLRQQTIEEQDKVTDWARLDSRALDFLADLIDNNKLKV